ncbi:MAG: hypothetical protein CMB55_07310 [Euryarchaeota archaeon]|nr:hypothetical protein [Euryarchaeota archaeon]|tara:strand:- start:140 stop:487 length:348 start_codon:yes stop_codon:yes gene_type:complete
MARIRIKVVGKGGYNGFALAMMIFVPLSVISFFNELANGCFNIFGGCEPPPLYYHYPRFFALVFAFFLLLLAFLAWPDSRNSETHEDNYPWGIIPGVIFGGFLFILSSVLGLMYQ